MPARRSDKNKPDPDTTVSADFKPDLFKGLENLGLAITTRGAEGVSSTDGATVPSPSAVDLPPPPDIGTPIPAWAPIRDAVAQREVKRPSRLSGLLEQSETRRAGVPERYDDGIDWLRSGLRRQRLATVLGLIFGWTGAWLALWGAVAGMFFGTLIAFGLVTSTSLGSDLFNLGVGNGVTLVSVLTGAVFGIAGGFVLTLKVLLFDRPLQAVIAILSGAVLSVIIVVVSASFERLGLRMRGYRRLSQEEVRRVAPLVKDVAEAMNLPALPRFAMNDVVIPNAGAHMRTIVITKGLLQSLNDGEVRAILAHELHHWEAGDSVALKFVWAASLPIALMYDLGTYLSGGWVTVGGEVGKGIRTIAGLVGWIIAWPAGVLMKLVIVPVVSRRQRDCEYEADAAAAAIGLASELSSALQKMGAFESGRTGWEAAMAATHPPTELRLEALQAPRPDDWEYREDELRGPSRTEVRRLFGGLGRVAFWR
jgi:Zn-dependent protease with chaperone function